MVSRYFSHVRAWVFDLDNTLYPPEARLFDQIEVRMTAFVMEALSVDAAEADRLRKHYWAKYGTTLAGLMEVHGVDPGPYLHKVHDISLDRLTPDSELRARIADLPGRRIVYTNGTAEYAARVVEARGLSGVFDALYGVEEAGFRPKPERAAFESVFAADGLSPAQAAMFEDDPRNLAAPHDMGMRTVHVAPAPETAPHIHHHTPDLAGFLAGLDGRHGGGA
ncbi:putative hydrolase of the HAD superfamily [Rhodovulum iodosum]|uniref:Hydrolase of the HAD superfamily n=1 Tax=Rhodovulum iodosum TaxID=68291 RepID=A0ABV3XNN0_9RHOB|nr:pyrimidine 5'-nucleotidase [Rhodovulum robiginosum]RSK34827.1 pyrimidine 5'-nucleotidase [Rhodovulum robiginosum]